MSSKFGFRNLTAIKKKAQIFLPNYGNEYKIYRVSIDKWDSILKAKISFWLRYCRKGLEKFDYMTSMLWYSEENFLTSINLHSLEVTSMGTQWWGWGGIKTCLTNLLSRLARWKRPPSLPALTGAISENTYVTSGNSSPDSFFRGTYRELQYWPNFIS